MFPLFRLLSQLGYPDNELREPEATTLSAETNGLSGGEQVFSAWNPTGHIFDLRPDLATMPLLDLAAALLEMRRMLRSHDQTLNRIQLMRFERQYSNALWCRAIAEQVEMLAISGDSYRLLLTDGMDVVLLPAA